MSSSFNHQINPYSTLVSNDILNTWHVCNVTGLSTSTESQIRSWQTCGRMQTTVADLRQNAILVADLLQTAMDVADLR